ncbi:MAG: ferrous iron transport protein B [Methanosarcinales archaeon]|jgi:ferrous iron transport protein B|nr:ferrous iron transport protein B [Methanosarcinales archaeon]
MSDAAKFTIALAGNPNSGKTTLFNRLTKSNQKVGNWAGVTVEKKIGSYTKTKPGADEKETVSVVDLPGIYSLTPYSAEEIITRNFIIDEKPDLVINIVDATSMERNLYLTFQLKKLGSPMIVALNMMDEVEQNGTTIDFEKMSDMLGIPVVPISAIEGKSFSSKVAKLMGYKSSKAAEGGIERLIAKTNDILDHNFENRAFKTEDSFEKKKFDPALLKHAEDIDYDTQSAEIYSDIFKIVSATVHEGEKNIQRNRTAKIDRVLTNKWLGIPIFLVLMGIIFQFAFGPVGAFFSDLIEVFFSETLSEFIEGWFTAAGTAAWMTDLVVNGIIAGVGAVLTFIPQIVILFIFLTLMEDSGYLARVAFLMDRIFTKIGLSGKSFIPMLLGFGCTVPAVMAARTLDNEMDRKTTIFITPFMSCGARLPIYVLFIGAFFSAHQGLIMLTLYVLGIAVAIASAWLLKKTIFKGPESPFIMELPPYRFPDLYTYLQHVWEKARGFIIRAGTIIVLASIVIWFCQGYDFTLTAAEDPAESIFGVIGNLMVPFFEPLGFGDWRAVMSLLVGFVAKEAVVSAIEILYTSEDFAALFTPVTAFAFMVFTLLYLPCLAAFATIKRELNSWKLAIFAAAYQTAIAYTAAFIVYRIGLLTVQYLS